MTLNFQLVCSRTVVCLLFLTYFVLNESKLRKIPQVRTVLPEI